MLHNKMFRYPSAEAVIHVRISKTKSNQTGLKENSSKTQTNVYN